MSQTIQKLLWQEENVTHQNSGTPTTPNPARFYLLHTGIQDRFLGLPPDRQWGKQSCLKGFQALDLPIILHPLLLESTPQKDSSLGTVALSHLLVRSMAVGPGVKPSHSPLILEPKLHNSFLASGKPRTLPPLKLRDFSIIATNHKGALEETAREWTLYWWWCFVNLSRGAASFLLSTDVSQQPLARELPFELLGHFMREENRTSISSSQRSFHQGTGKSFLFPSVEQYQVRGGLNGKGGLENKCFTPFNGAWNTRGASDVLDDSEDCKKLQNFP